MAGGMFDWSVPALATGVLLACNTTDTVARRLASPQRSVTTRPNCTVAPLVAGATNVGEAAVASLRVTAGPDVWVHA